MTAQQDQAGTEVPRLRIELRAEHCVGAGQCVLAAPEVFDQDEEGVAVVLDEQPGPAHEDAIREAVDLCPSSALRLLRSAATD
ncbi:ferredoxin [Streptomyces sp. NBC_00669]|uniref:ferredoxin n=1 Tax=Streptomyces sp. NBC_00669 TaxID=2976011 RepID=UPI002E2ED6FA|nr:ferredoxin [Streptomyces sp. NBC_00669]